MTLNEFIQKHISHIDSPYIQYIWVKDAHSTNVNETFGTLYELENWAFENQQIKIDIPGSISVYNEHITFWVNEKEDNNEVPW